VQEILPLPAEATGLVREANRMGELTFDRYDRMLMLTVYSVPPSIIVSRAFVTFAALYFFPVYQTFTTNQVIPFLKKYITIGSNYSSLTRPANVT